MVLVVCTFILPLARAEHVFNFNSFSITLSEAVDTFDDKIQ